MEGGCVASNLQLASAQASALQAVRLPRIQRRCDRSRVPDGCAHRCSLTQLRGLKRGREVQGEDW